MSRLAKRYARVRGFIKDMKRHGKQAKKEKHPSTSGTTLDQFPKQNHVYDFYLKKLESVANVDKWSITRK